MEKISVFYFKRGSKNEKRNSSENNGTMRTFYSCSYNTKIFSIMVPIAGAGAMRISFAGIFIKMPAVLFGGAIGGVVSGVVDILAYIIKPMGAYIPF